MKSASLTALENVFYLPAEVKQPLLLLCNCCFRRDEPRFGHDRSMLRVSSIPHLYCLQPHLPGSEAARAPVSCVSGFGVSQPLSHPQLQHIQ